jgi:hypothetical protein
VPTEVVAPAPASDDTESVEALELRAQQAFVEGRYDDVVELAAEAFARTGELRHLYAQAHAQRFAGRCAEALGLYARVMAAEPDGVLGRHARDGIKLCESQLEPATTPPPRPVPEPRARITTPAPPPELQRRAPDLLGSVLLGFGVGSIATGIAFAVLAADHAERLDSADDEQSLLVEQRRARGFEAAAIAASVLGTGLVVGGIVRLVQHSRSHPRRSRRTQ